MLYIGSHTSFIENKQLLGVVEESLSYKANAFMFYTGPNQSTLRKPINRDLTIKAHELMKKNNIDKTKCVVHAPFIINLANNTDERKYDFYISFLIQELNRCKELDICSLVLHPGSFTTLDRQKGIESIAHALNIALKQISGVNLLLEYMSGKGSEVGTSIDDLANIIDLLEKDVYDKVYVCLDTCHINDSGVNLNNFDIFLDEFDEKIGINKIKCIHINDSLNVIEAHKDRHANIGYGTIGFNTLINVIYNPRLGEIPRILETPWINRNEKDAYAPYKEEINMIRNKIFVDFINK